MVEFGCICVFVAATLVDGASQTAALVTITFASATSEQLEPARPLRLLLAS